MKKPHKERDPARTKKVLAFLSDGFDDYIAARVLFLAQLPQQAAILSSTAIEKCFKAILAFRGNESHGHLKTAHWNAVQNFDKEVFGDLDREFIELNRKAYRLRYTDDVPPEFNLVIASREFLAELDYTIAKISLAFTAEQNGKVQKTPYQTALDSGNDRLAVENHVISKQSRDEFIYGSPQFIYEVRNDPFRGLVEITYTTQSPPKVPGFLRPGFVPLDGKGGEYELSHSQILRPPPYEH
jgi:hypothetical protein